MRDFAVAIVLSLNTASALAQTATLHIEVSTVKNHVHNLFEKLHVKSRMQAAAHLGSHMTVRQRVLGLTAQPDRD